MRQSISGDFFARKLASDDLVDSPHFTILMLLSSTTWRLNTGQPGWRISQAKAGQRLGRGGGLFDVWQTPANLDSADPCGGWAGGARIASWAAICNTLSGSSVLVTVVTGLCTSADKLFGILGDSSLFY